MERSEIRPGTREEALVNTHEQSLSLAVSAGKVTIKREGMKQSHFPAGETLIFEFIFHFSSEEVLRVEPQNTLPFDFHSSL